MAADPSPKAPDTAVEPLITYREAAEILGVTERTVSSLVKEGKLRAVRFGRSVRFDPADIRAFIEQGKRGGGQ